MQRNGTYRSMKKGNNLQKFIAQLLYPLKYKLIMMLVITWYIW